MRNENYKTQTCCWFLLNKCSFNESCIYLHKLDEKENPIGWNSEKDDDKQVFFPSGLNKHKYVKVNGEWTNFE